MFEFDHAETALFITIRSSFQEESLYDLHCTSGLSSLQE